MRNLKNNNEELKNKTGYYITMVVSMLLGIALVLGTPLFNDFGSKQNLNHLTIPTHPVSPTGGSSY